MAVKVSNRENGKSVSIEISGSFDYGMQREFRAAYQNARAMGVEFHVNMKEVGFIDSSALGMLILLKDHAESLQGKVIIDAAPEPVRRVLLNAKFDRLFTISR